MAKIDTTAIEGFDTMSDADKLTALLGFEYEDGSAEIERLKAATSKANSEAAEWKRKHNALLSDDERKKQESAQEMETMKAELEELRKDKLLSGYTAKFVAQGYSEELAAETAKALLDGDTDTVFANANKFLEEYGKKVKADGLKKTPRPPAGGSDAPLTKADIMKIKDSAERQAAIAANIDLFRKDA